LRLMGLAIIKSTGPLIWAGVILLLLMFLYAVVFLYGVAEYIDIAGQDDMWVDDMRVFFASMPMALLTLFMSISGGVSWWEVQRLLLEVSWVHGLLFVLYIATMFLAVLNIITGIFVTDAVDMASNDHDMMVQAESDQRRLHIERLNNLFAEIDDNGNGLVSLEEFKKHVDKPEIEVIFSMLGLDVVDVETFFKHIDADGSGEWQLEEFVIGCLRLKGKTKAVGLEMGFQETKRLIRKLMESQATMHRRLRQLDSLREDVSVLSSKLEPARLSTHSAQEEPAFPT